MTSSKTITVGDTGVLIRMDVKSNISLSSIHDLRVTKPDSTVVTWAGTISGTDIIEYLTVEGDLDQAGVYTVNPKVAVGNFDGHGIKDTFYVGNPGDV